MITLVCIHISRLLSSVRRILAVVGTKPIRREVSFVHDASSREKSLEIVGRGGQIPAHHDILETEVFDEVLVLLARLDRERVRLINGCEHEQFLRANLNKRIDYWRLKRLIDLPKAVQKGALCRLVRASRSLFCLEHDACTADIAELQWHIGHNVRLGEKMLSKIDFARVWHRQLDVEVSDIRQTVPLVSEKVQLELSEFKRIEDALKETEHDLMLSRTKNADTLDKSTRAHQRVAIEREEIRDELDRASQALQRITYVSRSTSMKTRLLVRRSKLDASIDQHASYEKTIADAQVTVESHRTAYSDECKKRDDARSATSTMKLKVKYVSTFFSSSIGLIS